MAGKVEDEDVSKDLGDGQGLKGLRSGAVVLAVLVLVLGGSYEVAHQSAGPRLASGYRTRLIRYLVKHVFLECGHGQADLCPFLRKERQIEEACR